MYEAKPNFDVAMKLIRKLLQTPVALTPCVSPGALTQGVPSPVAGMDCIVKKQALTVIFESDSQAEASIYLQSQKATQSGSGATNQ